MSSETVCLICGSKRIDCSRGRVPCECRLDPEERAAVPLIIPGVGFGDGSVRQWCGRTVPHDVSLSTWMQPRPCDHPEIDRRFCRI